MKKTTLRIVLVFAATLGFVNEGMGVGPQRKDAADSGPPNPGTAFTSPPPVFQRGNHLSVQLPDGHPDVQGFLDFYSGIVIQKLNGTAVPSVAYTDLVSLPPRYLDIADNGGDPRSGKFDTSLVCQSCHDSDWTKAGQNLPNMSFWAQGSPAATKGGNPHDLAANWSLFGDWSGSIKALAGRDPVFLAQVESTRQINAGIKPGSIDNLCFRCHSPLAQRQITAAGESFDHSMLYCTGKDSGHQNPASCGTDFKYAEIGALARDGISCAACHTIQPQGGPPWDSQHYAVFYGDDVTNPFGGDVVGRIQKMDSSQDLHPPPYPFTAMMNTQPGSIVGPDSQLNTSPMSRIGLNLATAVSTGGAQSYLSDGTVCGSCHAVILPTVPTDYAPGKQIPDTYDRPVSCTKAHTTFQADGDYMTDPCVGLDYEQTTYFEWLNSGYSGASGTALATCMTCHMSIASTQTPKGNQYVAQCNADLAKYYGDPLCKADSATLTGRQFNRHSLLGINLFVHEMFQQYTDVLGAQFYRESNSVVPPYLQAASQPQGPSGNLLDNPGAESGNTNEWTPGPLSQIAANTGDATFTPHSGQYYFRLTGTATRTIDLTHYASLIDAGGAMAILTGYARSESTYTLPIPGASVQAPVPVQLTLQGNNGALSASFPPLSSANYGVWNSGPPSIYHLSPGEHSITIAASSQYSVSFPLFNGSGQGGFDDLSLTLVPGGVQPGSPLQDAQRNYQIPNNLLNAEQSIVDLALNTAQGQAGTGKPAVKVDIKSAQLDARTGTVTVKVKVTNNAGHKFPSGAPFRRAFVELQLLDEYGGVVWASGQPNAYGAICDGACNSDGSNLLTSEFTDDPTLLQPHYQTITRQDQVQIYEERATDDLGKVTSKELQIFNKVKDNRLLPQFWTPPGDLSSDTTLFGLNLKHLADLTKPIDKVPNSQLWNDPDYTDKTKTGADHLTYQIQLPGDGGPTVTRVVARVHYQSIPPGYLAARFKEAGDSKLTMGPPGPAMQRLIYMTSRLNLDLGLKNVANPGHPTDFVKDWTMVLSEATEPLKHSQGQSEKQVKSSSQARR